MFIYFYLYSCIYAKTRPYGPETAMSKKPNKNTRNNFSKRGHTQNCFASKAHMNLQ